MSTPDNAGVLSDGSDEGRGHEGEWRGQDKEHWCSRTGHVEGAVCEHSEEQIEDEHWSCCGAMEYDSPCLKGAQVDGKELEDNCVYVHETQRWFPIVSWGAKRLPTDIPEWCDSKRKPAKKEDAMPPQGCVWRSGWEIENAEEDSGWEYSRDWWWKYHQPRKRGDCVRRRKWKRKYAKADKLEINVKKEEFDEIKLTDDLVIFEGPECVKHAKGWRVVLCNDVNPEQKKSVLVDLISDDSNIFTVVPVPPNELTFLTEQPPLHSVKCSRPAGKGTRREHGYLFLSATHASFVTQPYKYHILIAFKNCLKIDKALAWKGHAIKFLVKSPSGVVEHLFEGFKSEDNTFKCLQENAGGATRVRGTSVREKSDYGSEEGEVVRTPKSPVKMFKAFSKSLTPKGTPKGTPRGSPALSPVSPTRMVTENSPSSGDVDVDVDGMHRYFKDLEVDKNFLEEQTLTKQIRDAEPCPPGKTPRDAFRLLFSENSTFLTAYHQKRGEYMGSKEKPLPCVMDSWNHPGGEADVGWRSFTCNTIIQAPWNKHTTYVEWQRYALNDEKLRVHFTSQTPDVMTGDSFRIEVLVEVVLVDKVNTICEMRVTGEVHFVKATWLRSKITSTAIGELALTYEQFTKQALVILSAKAPSTSTLKNRNSNSSSKKKQQHPTLQPTPTPEEVVSKKTVMSYVVEYYQQTLFGLCLVVFLYTVYTLWRVGSSTTQAVQAYLDLAEALSSAASNDSYRPLLTGTDPGFHVNTVSLALANTQLVVLLFFTLFLSGVITFAMSVGEKR